MRYVCVLYVRSAELRIIKKIREKKSEVLLPRLTGPMWGLRAAEGGETK